MRKGIAAVFITLGLCTCPSTPDAYFATDIRVIPSDQLNQCRRIAKKPPRLIIPADFIPLRAYGSVTLQYLIDSNGSVFNREVIESATAGVYDRTALKYLSLVRYIPADTNPGRTHDKTI